MTNKNSRLTPVIIAVSIVIGILIGTFYTEHFSGNRLGIINSSSNKLNALLRIINEQYMDEISMDSIVEEAMPLILEELDPHSKYIPAKDLEAVNSELEGKFSGVGLVFQINHDTIVINKVIAGGPSEKVGLLPGDRILEVDGEPFTGKKINNEYATSHLRGEKGSKVKLTVKRYGQEKPLDFIITRGDVPVSSVKAAYMFDDQTGYIRFENFGRTTHMEMLNALAILSHKGMKGVIIDLRGNTGGIFEVAVQMANEFLSRGQLIVYAEGRKYPRNDKRANGNGSFQKLPLIVLVDEYSASASEIFAGAIQDNDRGLVIGRRTFGKGLVQQPIEFSDGSAIRLTVARYYTAAGRCIQRPYNRGYDENYELDILNRYNRGEFSYQDSIHLNKEKTFYTTRLHRPVYEASGIMPDIFVPLDTLGYTSWFLAVRNLYLPEQFCFNYIDTHRSELQEYSNIDELVEHLRKEKIVDKFATFAHAHGVKRRNLMIKKSHLLIEERLFSNIIYIVLGESSMYQYLNQSDQTVLTAAKLIEEGKAYPEAPVLDEDSASKAKPSATKGKKD